MLDYASRGWLAFPGAHPTKGGPRACSCDRVGCPAPGAHPVSPAWQLQATTDRNRLSRWWGQHPDANVILPTGRAFDVLDVPAPAGTRALTRMRQQHVQVGPVATSGERYLFFVTTRGAPDDEWEWWSCHLDSAPEPVAETPGLRWHCRDSYVLAPPSSLMGGQHVSWVRQPNGQELPDPVRLLEVLADTCDEADPAPR